MGRVLALQKGIIYGPVDSRRLGRSLGINLMPTGYKVCSFNCIYCHYGWTKYLEPDVSRHIRELPAAGEVERELEKTLRTIEPPQFITFSGNGEASLHPEFPAIVDAVLSVRDRVGSSARVAILSNSTGVSSAGVRQALQKLDLRIMKLDAGTPEVLSRINRPARGISLDRIGEGLSLLRDVTLQSAFVEGEVTNSTAEDIETWLAQVKPIKPTFVQVYSLENAPAMDTLTGVPTPKLEGIVRRLEGIGIKAGAY
jgi:wyosine [tRNA(Phe)-imidazoG37] synthetase (radical SAM superfamily)